MTQKHILIVDDEALIADTTADFLKRKGYLTTCTVSGEKAVQILKKGFLPDLILMDIDLGPGRMDGTETAKSINAVYDIPVVFHSCHTDEATINKTRTVSKYGIIDKVPGNEIFLLATIEMAFSLHETTRKLKESEARYRTLAEAAHDVIFIINRQERVEYVNTFAAGRFKHRPEDILGKPLKTIFPPATFKHQHQAIQSVFRTGQSLYRESTIQFPTGEAWLGTWLVPMKDKTGAPQAVLGIARDISERKHIEKTQMESLHLLRKTYAGLHDAVFIIDSDSPKILDCNPAAARMFGYTQKEMIGKTTAMLHTGAFTVGEFKKFRQDEMDAKGFVFFPNFQMRRRDGTVFHVEFTMVPLAGEQKNIVGWMGVVHDITERQKTESALRESEEHFRNLFENSTMGIYRTMPDGRILLANTALVRMLGYSSFHELSRRNLEKDGFEPSYPRDQFKKRIEREGEVKGLESAWARRDGTIIHVRESARTVRSANGTVQYYEGTVEDVTEKMHAEEQMRKALAEKDVLLKELQHRVKNNMSVISSLISLEMRNVTDPAAVRVLSETCNRIKSITRIYQTLSQSTDLKSIDCRLYIEDLARELFHVYNIHSNTVRLNVEVEDVHIDMKKAIPCGLILNELFTNALKHAFPNDQTGTIDVSMKKKNGKNIELIVKDDGVGFSQPLGNKALKTMGMHIVKMMVEQMGGRMRFVGVKKGVECRILFPA